MINDDEIKYFQGNLDSNTVYIFIDESGNPNNKLFEHITMDIQQNGKVSNDIKTYTLTALVIKSVKQYGFLEKEMNDIKKDFFPNQNPELITLHRTDLRNDLFRKENNLSLEQVYLLENKIYKLIRVHRLITFSISCNREVLLDNPNYQYDEKTNWKEVLFHNLLMKIQRNIKRKNRRQKLVLVIETTQKKNDKKIVKFINELIQKKDLWLFKKVLITNKVNKKRESILGNELVDFICYSYFLWACNSLFHYSKFSLSGYPNHYKKSLTLIDTLKIK